MEGVERMRTFMLCTILYFIGAFFTNSYCQVYRWEDWKDPNAKYRTPKAVAMDKTVGATIGWPIYWTSRFTTHLVSPKEPSE